MHIDSPDRITYIPITESCKNALVSSTPLQKARYVWIDAICINGTDAVEKARQIPLMSSIYSKAGLVVGHLSGSTVGTGSMAKTPVGDFVRCLLQSNRIGSSWRIFRESRSPQEEYDVPVPKKADFEQFGGAYASADWESLVELVDNAYWRRAWIIQEIVLAEGLLLCCGSSCFTFEEFAEVSRLVSAFLVDPSQKSCHGDAVLRLRAFNKTVTTINEYKTKVGRSRSGRQNRLTVAEIMVSWKSPIEATIARDQIYAMLGLSSDADEPVLRPNYDASLTDNEISVQVATHYLQRGTCLGFFYMAGISYRPVTVPGLPSWAPDLSRRCETRKRFWEASQSGGCLRGATFSPDSKMLSVRGCILDELRVISSADRRPLRKWLKEQASPDGRRQPYEAGDIVKKSEEISRDHVPDPYLDGSTREEAYWRAMTMNRDLEGSPAAPDSQIFFKDVISWIMKRSESAETTDDEWFTPQRIERMVKRMERAMLFVEVWAEYAFSVSKEGYMAWVPPRAKDGDVFCLFEGCDVPFLLRRANGQGGYYLVGEAYLYGFTPKAALRSNKTLIHII
jgi:hypothetical protein